MPICQPQTHSGKTTTGSYVNPEVPQLTMTRPLSLRTAPVLSVPEPYHHPARKNEYQQILSFLPSTTNVAIENIRPLSSFVDEVMFEDAALLSQRQSPTQDDNSDAANTKGSSV